MDRIGLTTLTYPELLSADRALLKLLSMDVWGKETTDSMRRDHDLIQEEIERRTP